MNDISDLVESGQVPICPLCSNPVMFGEEFAACLAHGFVVLAHEMCLAPEDEEDDE